MNVATQADDGNIERKSLLERVSNERIRKAGGVALTIIGAVGLVAVVAFMFYLIRTANIIDG